MTDVLLQILCLAVWSLTVVFVCRQARLIGLLRQQMAAYISTRDKASNEYQRTVKALLDCSRGVNATLHEHDRRLRLISTKQEEIAQHEPGSARYREAVTLLRQGADEDELIGSCGLSRGEAHLIAHMERLKNRVA